LRYADFDVLDASRRQAVAPAGGLGRYPFNIVMTYAAPHQVSAIG
jgi:hypothetical protein